MISDNGISKGKILDPHKCLRRKDTTTHLIFSSILFVYGIILSDVIYYSDILISRHLQMDTLVDNLRVEKF